MIPSRAVVPIVLASAAVANHFAPLSRWNRFCYLILVFTAAVWLIAVVRGRLRNALLTVAAVIACFIPAELYTVVVKPPPLEIMTPGYHVWRAVLGWGPAHPGVFRQTKIDAKTGRVIFDVDYTIDDNLMRKVVSAPDGPTIAFFGDSMTFGIGVPDDQTLPQQFADLTERRFHVLNASLSGSGPQQLLRALDTGLYDTLLTPTRFIVYLTAPWHAERSACLRSFMFSAPRYELVDGKPQFDGICGDTWPSRLRVALALTSVTESFVEPLLGRAGPQALDLYIAILVRAGNLARERYGARTIILYLRNPAYLQQTGVSDDEIMQRLRNGGLIVVDAMLTPAATAGETLYIPGDGHPTGAANRAFAKLLRQELDTLPP